MCRSDSSSPSGGEGSTYTYQDLHYMCSLFSSFRPVLLNQTVQFLGHLQ